MHIAVITPTFNIAQLLPDAILSVRAQTHADWSLIVIDDGSTDHTTTVAANFSDPRLRLLRQDNAGVSAARNRGIAAFLGRPCHEPSQPDAPAQAKSPAGPRPDAFLFLDGDDWLAPDALATLAATLAAAPWAVAACASYARVSPDGRTTRCPAPPSGCLLQPLLTRNLFANGGHVLIRCDALESAGAFRHDLSYGEDWEFWIRIALQGEFVAVSSPLPALFVRERPGSAYFSYATDPAAYRPVIDAIYDNAAILKRVESTQLRRLREKAQAEIAWTIGRELVRHGQNQAGCRWLARSVCRFPSVKRLVLLGLAALRTGPFRPYQSVA